MSKGISYNTSKENLTISEYGRAVQELIQYAKTIENDQERQAVAEEIIVLMHQLNPQQGKSIEEYKDKLWRHLFRIADYDIRVMPPNGIIPTLEEATRKPEKIPYPEHEAEYRHYGHYVHMMINKAMEMEAGPIRDGFVNAIGSYMKMAFKTWNKEHYVSDEMIIADLERISGGILKPEENTSFGGGGRDMGPQQGGYGRQPRKFGQFKQGQRDHRNFRGRSNQRRRK